MTAIPDNIARKLDRVPNKPGVYMMLDHEGHVIYVGKATSLRARVRSYFQQGQNHLPKTLIMLSKVHDLDWLVTHTEVEALMLECNLIKRHRPRYNVRLRDDKHYPYLCVTTAEPFPRVLVVRRVRQDGNKYFGPYADSSAMRETLRLIRKVFRIRSCNKRLSGSEKDKPCLNLHLGQCESPCSGRISSQDYSALVRDACLFLEGRSDSLIRRLNADMLRASDSLQFEKAARLRDQIDAIRKVVERQQIINTNLQDQDVVAFTPLGDLACVQILFVRAGKLVGREHFFLEGMEDESPQTGLSQFLMQYYRDATHIPREILISHPVEESLVLEAWLSEKRGTKVRLIHPKRGEKLNLVRMAAENALEAAEREGLRQDSIHTETLAGLEALRRDLALPSLPQRIEAFDISNIQGHQAVGSMVVFEHGLPAKSQYRRFKIRTLHQPDDYAMMREIILRRFAAARDGDPKFTTLPDLILIDGGRGQLNAALDAISALMTDGHWLPTEDQPSRPVCPQPVIISLAKRLEEVFMPNRSEPLMLPRDSRSLHILQRLRDEAHRFALAYHHSLREKSSRSSILDAIPGIGDARRKALIRRFGSVAGVKAASLDDLLSVPGMNRSAAQAVYDALHPEG